MLKIIKLGAKFQLRHFSTGLKLNNTSNEHLKLIENTIRKIRVYDEIDLLPADLDWNYILNTKNIQFINDNVNLRKGNGDILGLHKLNDDLKVALKTNSENKHEIELLIEKMYRKAVQLPNFSDPTSPVGAEDKAECVLKLGDKKGKTPTVDQIAKLYGWLKDEQLPLYSTQRSYIIKKELADLETALVKYTLRFLNEKGFVLISVPDILHHSIIESCGFQTKGDRNQVYKLDYLNEYGKYCLSGTSEMSLAGLLKNRVFNESELPLKLCAVSRCFRAEVSGSEREGKLFRLHEFTKAEMFVITLGDTKISSKMLEEIKSYEIELFSDLGLHFRVLNMPTQELGSPAYKKYDIEAWMPGNQFYGEISSTSNCTNYQSRRLHIKSSKNKLDLNEPQSYVHTLNGTACAIPRMLTAIIESNWDMENEQVHIPKKLQPFMQNKQVIKVPKDFRKAEALRAFK
ncbi:unnamed protein product [Brachionus calyciflorus]|uniref:serine--tRNA ligase n=1 Tax=Brachionus calyciflorus TaxID=104777 RepID=A0A813SBK4_9BILA|nr:unnamed protein product [Brachionus calyciflorus]